MRTASFTSIILSALALGSSSLVNAKSSGDLKNFATGLGLSKTDVDALVNSYNGSPNKRVRDLSCEVLNFLFPDSTNLPEEAAYAAKISINWSTRAWLNSTCVFSPNSTEATSVGVKVANFFGTQFAIRSGGHTPDPAMASISEGILFSLENLNQIKLDSTKKVASIGPGNRWGHVYTTLGPQDFLVVGGRVPPVGVGGLITGGGLSQFSATEGLAADTVQNFEVVLGDGRIVNANSKENSDLWWALKGGGNNFGIVTRFDMKAIPKPGGLVWGGVLYFLPSQYHDVMDAIVQFQTEGQVADPKAAIIASFVNSPAAQTEILTLSVFYQDPVDTIPPVLQRFFDLGPVQNTAAKKTLAEQAADTYGPALDVPPMRQLFRTLSYGLSEEQYQWALNHWNETFSNPEINGVPGFMIAFVYQPIPVSLVTAGNAAGGNALGLSKKAHVWHDINLQWALPSDDELMIATSKKFVAALQANAKKLGVADDFFYLNDAAKDQPVIKSYGKENVKRLQKVSKKYDPKQVFQKQVPGGFKLN